MSTHASRPDAHNLLPASLAWRLLVPFLAACGLVIIAIIALTAATAISFSAALVRFGPLLLAGAGFSIMFTGARRRVGDSEHCAACDYEIRPGVDTAAVCPECGARWLAPGGTVVGRLKRNRALFWTGLVVAALCLAGPLSGLLSGRSLHLKATPTSRIIDRIVAAPPGGTTAEWDELATRVLTADQEVDLAWGLLDKRLDRGGLSRDADAWLEATMDSGRLPETLVDRYYDEP
ncbi:MAG: hypothetical protein ACYS15_10705 [Planctomycetota bacterium]|jgi:predicted RNA-binding Zn-ribbon protein involved in translation (DUF1610 family)